MSASEDRDEPFVDNALRDADESTGRVVYTQPDEELVAMLSDSCSEEDLR